MTILKVVCMWCRKAMGEKDGEGQEGLSHSICEECWKKYYPEWPYPKEVENERD